MAQLEFDFEWRITLFTLVLLPLLISLGFWQLQRAEEKAQLAAAFELQQAGHRVVVIERSGEVGGRVKTVQAAGASLDLGFQVLLSAYPLANKYLDMDALNLRKLASGALVYTGGSTHLIGDPLRDWKVLLPTPQGNNEEAADAVKQMMVLIKSDLALLGIRHDVFAFGAAVLLTQQNDLRFHAHHFQYFHAGCPGLSNRCKPNLVKFIQRITL